MYYEVEDCMILYSGRKLPGEGEPVRRGEGVGIVLSPEATRAWRDGGEQWEAISSRIVTARLKMKGGRHVQHLVIVSVYAPTFRAPIVEKEGFYEDLQRVLDQVSERDVLVVMGDWNARVGSSVGRGQWDGVIGRHGLGKMNEAGLFLLSFCATNNLSIMNTFFEKRDIYKQSWQHPGTKVWHCIDFILMRQSQRKKCVDVQVMRGAECWSDHRMVRAKIRVDYRPQRKAKRGAGSMKQLNMSQLRCERVRSEFDNNLSQLLDRKWSACSSVQEKWELLVNSTKCVATAVIPKTSRRSADWFLENEHVIRPALEKRGHLLDAWLSTKHGEDRLRYVKQRGAVQRLIRQIKNEWFQKKVAEIELAMSRSRSAWKSIRQL